MSTALANECAEFIDYLRDVRQLSPHTLENYRRDLASLQRRPYTVGSDDNLSCTHA